MKGSTAKDYYCVKKPFHGLIDVKLPKGKKFIKGFRYLYTCGNGEIRELKVLEIFQHLGA